jgi:hypothetical protein
MPSDNVIRPDFNTRYPKNAELAERIHNVISDYHNQVSLAEVIGVLEMVKLTIMQANLEDEED